MNELDFEYELHLENKFILDSMKKHHISFEVAYPLIKKTACQTEIEYQGWLNCHD